MTKKDYELIADIIREAQIRLGPRVDSSTIFNELRYDFGIALKKDNPSFNQAKFASAATPKP